MAGIKFPDIDLNGVKGVLIDLDDTLYHYDPCHNFALKSCFDKFFEDKLSFAEFAAIYKKKRDEVVENLKGQGACRSRFFAFQHLLEELGDHQSYVNAMNLDVLYWSSFIEVMKVDESAKTFLEKCSAEKIPVCVVTDMLAVTQVQKLQKLQLTKHVKYLVSSEEVGVEKPSELMFLTALKKLNLAAENVIMIGDNFDKDIFGAESLGIKSYRVTNSL